MIYQPPAGARDLLPLEVEQKRWINDRLQHVFQQWGYQRIVTSTLEWLDTLMAGDAIKPVTRMADQTYPQRLCYRANVFRNPPQSHHGRQLEFYQAGVELLFAGGVLADAEIILLLAHCLETLGVNNWSLLLGNAGLTRSLLAVFPSTLRKQVRYCIANLDRITLENMALEPALKERALWLFDLRGNPETVLEQVKTLDLDNHDTSIAKR